MHSRSSSVPSREEGIPSNKEFPTAYQSYKGLMVTQGHGNVHLAMTGVNVSTLHLVQEDLSTCRYCGSTPQNDGMQLHVDHVKPRVAGGSNEESNLVTACMDRNLGKGKSILGAL